MLKGKQIVFALKKPTIHRISDNIEEDFRNQKTSYVWDNIEKIGDCWIWKGKRFIRCRVGPYKIECGLVPRKAIWVVFGGKADDKITNNCGNKNCINPSHHYVYSKS